MDRLFLREAPPLAPEWLEYEKAAGLLDPKPTVTILERQPIYADECRQLHATMMAPGARDAYLTQGIVKSSFTVPSSVDGIDIPVMLLELDHRANGKHNGKAASRVAVVYIHGGGLYVGEADSEELSCRRLLKDSGLADAAVYSIGYRLLPMYPASTCVADCMDAFQSIKARESDAKIILVGSSSGGGLASLLSQAVSKTDIHGVMLRCPVTSDAFSGKQYVPERLRALHNSAQEMSFRTSLLSTLTRGVPRDGLPLMPLEAPEQVLKEMPKHWIQVCTNDVLYSDGTCYAKALEDAGVQVHVDVVKGWPHTFWLKAPQLQRAWEADEEMLKGLAWILE